MIQSSGTHAKISRKTTATMTNAVIDILTTGWSGIGSEEDEKSHPSTDAVRAEMSFKTVTSCLFGVSVERPVGLFFGLSAVAQSQARSRIFMSSPRRFLGQV